MCSFLYRQTFAHLSFVKDYFEMAKLTALVFDL